MRQKSVGWTAGDHKYVIEMAFEENEGKWYEIWEDGRLLGKRTNWPLDKDKPVSEEEFIAQTKLMFEEMLRRKAEVS
jgi:hypothetical protein